MPLEASQWITSIGSQSVSHVATLCLEFYRLYETISQSSRLKICMLYDRSITYNWLSWDTGFKINFSFCLSVSRQLTHGPCHVVVLGPGGARNPPHLAGRHSSFRSSQTSPQLASRRTSRRWRSHETGVLFRYGETRTSLSQSHKKKPQDASHHGESSFFKRVVPFL